LGFGIREGIVGAVLTAVVIVVDHGIVPVDLEQLHHLSDDGRDVDATVDVDDGAILLRVKDHPTAGVVDIVTLQAVSLPEGIVSVGIVQLAGAVLPLFGGDAVADELAGE
jgi:hypothetical protein